MIGEGFSFMYASRKIAQNVFETEAEAVRNLSKLLTDDFDRAIEKIVQTKGRLVVSGMGKSGHIGAKISATLASTGTLSFFMHPAEAMHGDLGMLTPDDIVLAISNSGETEEIVRIIPHIRSRGITLISMAGRADSTLARESDFFFNVAVEKEAGPDQIVPTSSTTAMLAMGDALAVALMEAREFRPENFAMFHPGGSLGRRLLTRVKDLMRTKPLPVVTPKSDFKQIISTMTTGRMGLCVVQKNDQVVGLITDGDLRRALERSDRSRFDFSAEEIMTRSPRTIAPDEMAVEAERIMIKHKINALIVMDDIRLVGVVQLYDIGIL